MSLLLANNGTSDIIVGVAKWRNAKATTLRAGQEMPTYLKVPARHSINVLDHLKVTKTEAVDILDRSQEVQKFLHPNGPLRIVDLDVPRRDKTDSQIQDIIKKNAEIIEEGKRIEAEWRKQKELAADPGHTPVEPIKNAAELEDQELRDMQASDASVDSLKATLVEGLPSTRWSREKLLDYAKKQGLTLDEHLSKNAILKALRRAQ